MNILDFYDSEELDDREIEGLLIRTFIEGGNLDCKMQIWCLFKLSYM